MIDDVLTSVLKKKNTKKAKNEPHLIQLSIFYVIGTSSFVHPVQRIISSWNAQNNEIGVELLQHSINKMIKKKVVHL